MINKAYYKMLKLLLSILFAVSRSGSTCFNFIPSVHNCEYKFSAYHSVNFDYESCAKIKRCINVEDEFLEFHIFALKYNKNYVSIDEYFHSMLAFTDNYHAIIDHNKKNTYQVGLNEFADIPNFLFRKESYYKTSYNPPQCNNTYKSSYNQSIPDSYDWRNYNVLTPVKNQGQCGSCWAFSSTGAVEAAYAIKTGNLTSFSEQQLMDCSGSFGNNGCSGGIMDDSFKYLLNHKLCSEKDYPYQAKDGTTCNKCPGVTTVSGCLDVKSGDSIELRKVLLEQPVSIAIEADTFGFQFYKSGVYSGKCGTNLDHGVLLVGYGTENGEDYWLVKNSWGSNWGDSGYIKIKQGLCGVNLQPSIPVID